VPSSAVVPPQGTFPSPLGNLALPRREIGPWTPSCCLQKPTPPLPRSPPTQLHLTLQGAGAAGATGKVCCGRLESEGAATAAAGAGASGAAAAAAAARARRATAAGRARGSAAATRGRGEVGGEVHGGRGAAAPSILILTAVHGPLPLILLPHTWPVGALPSITLASLLPHPCTLYACHTHARPLALAGCGRKQQGRGDLGGGAG
jgi:hypothetical protein